MLLGSALAAQPLLGLFQDAVDGALRTVQVPADPYNYTLL
jgi:hypothetical protein